ncbi:hypothetical protein F4813DRAFT_385650 [Daldinia decipiens]|uniref:uncharacterized protein n=1 Tax=Daldinia decipiens TaxID=326647 RepID=UPI0020C2623C|nr:uncharacterized protein F4813DRAFT_385650 [Daldinia decipiens]KAI1661115.1 hypothetical protein F4813DRAFT_385650 [Daldinia decipiens]
MAAQAQFACTSCDYVAMTRPNLSDHIRRMHIGVDCLFQGCNVRVTSEALLRKHISTVHGTIAAVDDLYECPWENCTRAFDTINSLHRCLFFHTYDTKMANNEISQEIRNLSNQVAQNHAVVTARLDGLDAIATSLAALHELTQAIADNQPGRENADKQGE